jgi:hypothetical protein
MATVRGVVSRRIVGDEAMVIVDRISEAYTGAPYEERSGFAVFLIRPRTSWANDYTA